ncbi:MAG: DUF2793 domain-containing protein [Hyphomicrobiaceae bacterium]
MDTTPNLGLPYLMAAQAQKHVTLNEAIRSLDVLVQTCVADRDLQTPPPDPADGAAYIVADGATGAWTGREGAIAAFQDGAWMFHPPREGWRAWIADEDLIAAYDGTAWVATGSGGGGGSGSVNPVALVGVNATADAGNRLSVASPAVLFSHEGAGHQAKINKAAATDTASLLFQTAFSGRAEIGTAGDDDLHIKVSADGSSWKEAIVIDRVTGEVALPNTSGGGATAYAKRAALRQTASTTVPTSTITAMSWQIAIEDVGGWFSSGQPTRLTVPAGVGLVELRAQMKLNAASGTNGVIIIERFNAAGALLVSYLDGLNYNLQYAGSITTPPIAVTPGDYFVMSINQNSGATRTTNTDIATLTIAMLA